MPAVKTCIGSLVGSPHKHYIQMYADVHVACTGNILAVLEKSTEVDPSEWELIDTLVIVVGHLGKDMGLLSTNLV